MCTAFRVGPAGPRALDPIVKGDPIRQKFKKMMSFMYLSHFQNQGNLR